MTTTPALPNTFQNKNIARNLVTGQHVVSDIGCKICGSVLGWKYVEAQEESQRYKVGKFILETKRVRRSVGWEGSSDCDDKNANMYDEVVPLSAKDLRNLRDPVLGPINKDGELEFDSQDEDECEDLFAGVWSPALAAKRRARKQERFGRKGKGNAGFVGYGGNSSNDTLA
jgi:hypothetical protein